MFYNWKEGLHAKKDVIITLYISITYRNIPQTKGKEKKRDYTMKTLIKTYDNVANLLFTIYWHFYLTGI